jgi:hypothetical protein
MKEEFNPSIESVKKDLFSILAKTPWEAYSVRQAIIKGRIDGRSYGGSCCCIKGIIAKNNGLDLRVGERIFNATYGIRTGLYSSSLEQYILVIRPGMKPENNGKCQQLLSWLDEFIAAKEAKQTLNLGAAVQAGLEEVLTAVSEAPELVQV